MPKDRCIRQLHLRAAEWCQGHSALFRYRRQANELDDRLFFPYLIGPHRKIDGIETKLWMLEESNGCPIADRRIRDLGLLPMRRTYGSIDCLAETHIYHLVKVRGLMKIGVQAGVGGIWGQLFDVV